MKIQSTELEFINFDASDVIATSGPDYSGKSMSATMTVLDQFNDQSSGSKFQKFISEQYGYWTISDTQYVGTWWKPNNYITFSAGSFTSSSVSSATPPANTDSHITLGSLAEVLCWLQANGMQ